MFENAALCSAGAMFWAQLMLAAAGTVLDVLDNAGIGSAICWPADSCLSPTRPEEETVNTR